MSAFDGGPIRHETDDNNVFILVMPQEARPIPSLPEWICKYAQTEWDALNAIPFKSQAKHLLQKLELNRKEQLPEEPDVAPVVINLQPMNSWPQSTITRVEELIKLQMLKRKVLLTLGIGTPIKNLPIYSAFTSVLFEKLREKIVAPRYRWR